MVDWRTVREIVLFIKPDWKPAYGNDETPDAKFYKLVRDVLNAHEGFNKISCVECNQKHHYWKMYRCWDCKGWLCEEHVMQHFGPKHVPHPRLLKQYEEEIAQLKQTIQNMLMENRTDEV